jgi:exonuclease SbcD
VLIAHLADLHLGFRSGNKLAPGGMNVRERDVALAFRACVDKIIELQPQLIVVAGDIFHVVRPSNHSIADAFAQFSRLSAETSAHVVVIAGNHESPKTAESGCILNLFRSIPRTAVMDMAVGRLETADFAVLGVPHTAAGATFTTEVVPNKVNVMVLHGSHDPDKMRDLGEFGGNQIDIDALHPEHWDYIALGHYHMLEQVRANTWYPGAIERTSNNIWAEALSEKGFLTYDTETRQNTFYVVPTRPVVDLPRILHANQHSASEINEHIASMLGAVQPDGKIVRLVIYDISRELQRDLDHQLIREFKARALHFHLDLRRPARQGAQGLLTGRIARPLEEELEHFVNNDFQPSSADIDKGYVIRLARKYLEEAGIADAAELREAMK